MSKENKKEKKKGQMGKWISGLLMLLMGGACGFLIARVADLGEESLGDLVWDLCFLVLAMYLVMFFQIIIHEAGHLLLGLLTGYQFSSFRILSFIFIREEKKLRCKRMSIPGTAGQCLMRPPKMQDGKCPYILYNLGGVLLNLAAAAACAILGVSVSGRVWLSNFFMIMAIVGVFYALQNGIPLHIGDIDNDGCNAISLGKNPKALQAFWLQMEINGLCAAGKKLSDMPDEWFEMPPKEDMRENVIVAVMGVFACNRMMEKLEFARADQMMEELLDSGADLMGLHRGCLVADQIYCEVMGKNRPQRLEKLLDKEQIAFQKSMKNFPSVLRTQYAYALLARKDEAEAGKLLEKFQKEAKKYPYPNDIETEQKLIMLCRQKAAMEAA